MKKVCLLAMLVCAARGQAVFVLDASQSHTAFTLPDVLLHSGEGRLADPRPDGTGL